MGLIVAERAGEKHGQVVTLWKTPKNAGCPVFINDCEQFTKPGRIEAN